MASNIQFTLDTSAPASVVLTAPANSGTLTVSVNASTSDADTTGYTMKLWGTGVSADTIAGTTKANAPVLAYTTASKVVTFLAEGSTQLNLAVYDDVGNETVATPVTINIVTTLATITVSNIGGGNTAHTKFSTTAPYNVLSFNFTSSMDYIEYRVLRVSTTGSLIGTGTAIGTTNGSTNVGAVETVTAGTPKSVTINMLDLPTQVNELKIIKVFVKNVAGNWSEA